VYSLTYVSRSVYKSVIVTSMYCIQPEDGRIPAETCCCLTKHWNTYYLHCVRWYSCRFNFSNYRISNSP